MTQPASPKQQPPRLRVRRRSNLLLRILHDFGELLVLAADSLGHARDLSHERAVLGSMGARKTPAAPSRNDPVQDTQVQTYTIVETYVPPLTWPGGTQGGGGTQPGGGGTGPGTGGPGSGGDGPPPKTSVKEKSTEKPYDSCTAAKSQLLAGDGTPDRPWPASTQYDMTASVGSGVAMQQADGSWQYTARGYLSAEAVVALPGWSNMPTDAATEAAWNAMIEEMRAHEQGHIDIIDAALQEMNGIQVVGTGASKDAAIADGKSNWLRQVQGLNDLIAQRMADYDLKTNHGKNQASVGGKNVELTCPPK